ncbi:MAG: BrnT family toxin [Pyrinomonadaceae bacterium]
MIFEWDENKRRKNLQNHGIDFADAAKIFDNTRYTIIDDRFDYGEIRFFTLGLITGRVIAVSHTESENVIRIISARKANKNEQAKYFKEITN